VKRRGNLTTFQMSRYVELLEERMSRAGGLQLDAAYVKSLFETIHEESVRRQSEIISGIDD
jgi:chorismate mutase